MKQNLILFISKIAVYVVVEFQSGSKRFHFTKMCPICLLHVLLFLKQNEKSF